jgi:multidrug efflux pump subunit AcrA (membrane-fusion protein)
MTEEKVKKRAWVKNAVIIFLAVMLVLTFFSNTIMNHSLPEVATTYVSSGTITAKIRGSGRVEAFESYEVKLSQTRTVDSVPVRNGDLVEVGDVLFRLSSETPDLDAAIDRLDELEYQYKVKLLNMTEADYASDDLQLRYLKEDLAKAEEERRDASVSDVELSAAQRAVDIAKRNVEALQNEIDGIKEERDKLGTGQGAPPDNTKQLEELRNKIYDKENEIYKAESELSTAVTNNAAYMNMLREYTRTHLLRDYVRTEILIKPYKGDITYVTPQNNTYNDWLLYLNAIATDSVPDRWKDWKVDVSSVDELEAIIDNEVTNTIDGYPELILKSNINKYLPAQAQELSAFPAGSTEKRMSEAYYEIENLKTQIATMDSELEALYRQFSSLLSDKDFEKYEALEEKRKSREKLKKAAEEELRASEEALAELKADEAEWEAANEKVRQLERQLEEKLLQLAKTKKGDTKTQALDELELERLRNQIRDAEQDVYELRSEAGEKEITAPVAGKITSLSVSAGDKIVSDTALVTIELIDRGYQLEFSITNEQAKKIRIGDLAEVSNYYWGPEITAQLIAMKNDPEAPREKKLLTFNLQGEIESGSQLSLSLGGRGADYEFIVPNSAIRTDNDGDFVLIIEQKSTPLGTRYMATRVGVNVMEKDDTNSAVSGGLVSWDYVITSSNKPVEPGDYVRLAEGQSR